MSFKNFLIPGILGCAMVAGTAFAQPNPKDKWDISKLDVSKLPPAATTTGLTYEKDIRPIFEASCFRCHGEQRPRGKFRVDSLEALMKGGDAGEFIVAGSADKSLLLLAVSQMDNGTAMPPKPRQRRPGGGGPGGPGGPGGGPGGNAAPQAAPGGAPGDAPPGGPGGGPPGAVFGGAGGPGGGPAPKPLTPEQVGIVRAWINQGAK